MNLPAHRDWLSVHHGDAPLIVSFPHSGTEIPDKIEEHLVSPWLARKDTDFWIDVLYDFAHELGATTIRTALSRTVIDVNRDPSGASMYPGQATTGLCPLDTFDGEPLYKSGSEAGPAEFLRRRTEYFDPYHSALRAELERKCTQFGCVVLYDAHSIRSRVPRLFDGELPQFNIGTNNGMTCAPDLTASIEKICAATRFTHITNGRFRGGWITRHYGNPASGVHAVQMELAMRGYLHEPEEPLNKNNWPAPLDDAHASHLRIALRDILDACVHFAKTRSRS
jgi:N-formylglutamate deformylase